MNLTVKLILLILLCCPGVVCAELSEQVQSDFAVVAGVIVMPINDEYIVDLDEHDNLHVGDILTLVTPGRKIFHPETREVLGSVDDVTGFLQVTRIYSGYSYAKALSDGLQPANGASLKRFEQVPAHFVDTSQEGGELARQIKLNLPQFQWLEGNSSDTALLTFTLQKDALEVKTAQGDSLFKYVVTDDQQLVSTTASARRPNVTSVSGPKPRLLQQFANSLMGTISVTNEERFAEMDEAIIRQNQLARQGVWMGPKLSGHPTGLAVADFDGDGLQEVAIVLEKKVLIARINDGQFTQLAEVEVPEVLQLLSVDALDLDGNGLSELYLSAVVGFRPSSMVIQYDGSKYSIAIDSVRWLLRAVTLPGDKGKSLLGQRIDDVDQVFKGEVFRAERKDDVLVAGTPVDLPAPLNLFNFIPVADHNEQLNYLYLTQGDYLKMISKDGEVLWTSDDYFGGSEDCFPLKEKLNDELQTATCMRPRMVMMPGNEILVVQNDGQRMVQRYRKFKKSKLVSLTWNNFALNESWRTASQPGYLGDFAYADADNDGDPELVMLIKFKHKGLTDEARSSLVIYELD